MAPKPHPLPLRVPPWRLLHSCSLLSSSSTCNAAPLILPSARNLPTLIRPISYSTLRRSVSPGRPQPEAGSESSVLEVGPLRLGDALRALRKALHFPVTASDSYWKVTNKCRTIAPILLSVARQGANTFSPLVWRASPAPSQRGPSHPPPQALQGLVSNEANLPHLHCRKQGHHAALPGRFQQGLLPGSASVSYHSVRTDKPPLRH